MHWDYTVKRIFGIDCGVSEMGIPSQMLALIFFALVSSLVVRPCIGACNYPALFCFGDSLSDTGNAIRTSPIFFTSTQSPYGETYFKRPAERFCDGRLIIDFLAQSVGLPFLNPYLASKEPGTDLDFSNGVNYAVAGATAEGSGLLFLNGGLNVLTTDNLNVQIGWHLDIKQRSTQQFPSGAQLPSPQSFSEALYFFAIGGNDYGSAFIRQNLRFGRMMKPLITTARALSILPTVLATIVNGIETLYANEARHFFIFNIGPQGCAPLFIKLLNGTLDAQGCLEAINQVAQASNQQLVNELEGLKKKYPDIDITFADYYTVYDNVVKDPATYGFQQTINACCGAGPGVKDQFQISKICNKLTYLCPDPSVFVQWDGIHQTDAFNRYVVNEFVSGNHITPSNALACATTIAR